MTELIEIIEVRDCTSTVKRVNTNRGDNGNTVRWLAREAGEGARRARVLVHTCEAKNIFLSV